MQRKQFKDIHVVARTKEGWVVKGEGQSRPVSVHDTQRDAIDAARVIARYQKGEVVIHGRDGRIRDRDSYGNDPVPPRDRRVLFPVTVRRTNETQIKKAVKEVMKRKN